MYYSFLLSIANIEQSLVLCMVHGLFFFSYQRLSNVSQKQAHTSPCELSGRSFLSVGRLLRGSPIYIVTCLCLAWPSRVLMSYPSLPCAAPLTASGPSRLASQANDIFVGHEWATPLPAVTTSTTWYSPESAIIQPPTGQVVEILPSDCYYGDMHGALPLHNEFQQESCGHECEQRKPAHFDCVCFFILFPDALSQAYANSVCAVSLAIHPRRFSNAHPQQLLRASNVTTSGWK